jgi:hypothetical protein
MSNKRGNLIGFYLVTNPEKLGQHLPQFVQS